MFVPELAEAEPPPEPAEDAAAELPPQFARTSDEQRSVRPDTAAFIGERDTRATSDAPPQADAPPLPSQAGEVPRHERDFETTQSRFQEGSDAPTPLPQAPLAEVAPPIAEPMREPIPESPPPQAANLGETTTEPEAAVAVADPLPESLAEGPNPVDVPMPPEPETEMSEATEPERPPDGLPDQPELADAANEPEAPPPPPRQPIQDPAFRSEQRKAAISGSISRTGTSALDVADTPMGRYQAAISKAVEEEWRRNCVRHRDFITPGFLSVRFYVQADGKVRNVAFVGVMETGEIQKGFTLNSIRDATIPPMPAPLRAELDGEPLELTFNFYF